jgi:tripartite-type tricarboxylate transporter receptor subunit TctC
MGRCMTQVAGGHTDLTIVALGAAKSMVDGGKVRLLASLGETRAAPPYEVSRRCASSDTTWATSR